MRSGTHASIVTVAPIDQIVPAFRPFCRVIGDFIARKPVQVANLFGSFVHLRAGLSRRQIAEASFFVKIAETGAGFYRQLVQRQVIHCHFCSFGQFFLPIGHRLRLACVNQIEADPFKMIACDIECSAGLGDRVQPAQ